MRFGYVIATCQSWRKNYSFEQVVTNAARIAFVSELIDKSVDKAALGLLIDVNVWWGEHGVSFCFEGETIFIKTKKNLPKENDNEQ